MVTIWSVFVCLSYVINLFVNLQILSGARHFPIRMEKSRCTNSNKKTTNSVLKTANLSLFSQGKKATRKRSALKKRANDSNNPEIIKLYKKQRNYAVTLSRKVKKEYFQKHMPHGASSKNFWKFCKPFFSNKTNNFDDKIMLMEN